MDLKTLKPDVRAGWLPVSITRAPRVVSWMNLGSAELDEPFFAQSVRSEDGAATLYTGIDGVAEAARCFAPVIPTAFIFHITRCGSTLLANAFRTDSSVTVVAEAQPITAALRAEASELERASESNGYPKSSEGLLQGLATVYGNHLASHPANLVIKFSGLNIIQASMVRAIWPKTPIYIVIRNPIEVVVSLLRNPPAWARYFHDPAVASAVFGWTIQKHPASIEEYFARSVGVLCGAAALLRGPHTTVIDYANLTELSVTCLGDDLGLKFGRRESVGAVFSRYSKGPAAAPFQSDSTEKRNSAPPALAEIVDRYTADIYRDIRFSQAAPIPGFT